MSTHSSLVWHEILYFPLFGGREICKNNFKDFFFMITQKSWIKKKIELGLML